MHKFIAGSACAAAVLSLAVASAQTYPQAPADRPATKSPPSTTSAPRSASPARPAAQQVTMTGCLTTRGTNTGAQSWTLANATRAGGATTASGPGAVTEKSGTVDESRVGTSRSGSPSNEGTSAGNPNRTADVRVSGSTSTGIGTSGTRTPAASVDTEAHGGGTLGATDQNGSTVGAGATAGVTAGSSDHSGRTRDTSGSAGAGPSYRLMGVKSPSQYANKRVEVVGTMSGTSNAANQTLRVTSVRVLGDTCQ